MSICSCPTPFPTVGNVTCKENFGQVQKVLFCLLPEFYESINQFPFTRDGVNASANGEYYPFDTYKCPLTNWGSGITQGIGNTTLFDPESIVKGDLVYKLLNGPIIEAVRGYATLVFNWLTGRTTDQFGESIITWDGEPFAWITPFLEAPTQEAGDPIVFDGGNDTPNGIEKYLGQGPSTFSAKMRGVPQDFIAKLKKLECVAKQKRLGVLLLNANGDMGCSDTDINGNTDIRLFTQEQGCQSSFRCLWPIPIRSLRIGDKVHGGLEEPDSNSISWQFLPNYSDSYRIVPASAFRGPDGNWPWDPLNKIKNYEGE